MAVWRVPGFSARYIIHGFQRFALNRIFTQVNTDFIRSSHTSNFLNINSNAQRFLSEVSFLTVYNCRQETETLLQGVILGPRLFIYVYNFWMVVMVERAETPLAVPLITFLIPSLHRFLLLYARGFVHITECTFYHRFMADISYIFLKIYVRLLSS